MNRRTQAAVAWSILILALCWVPRSWFLEIKWYSGAGFAFGNLNLDKLVHLAFFLGFGLLWARALGNPPSRARTRALWIGGILFASLSELGQALPFIDRTMHFLDLIFDLLGLAIGIGIHHLLERRLDRQPAT